MQTIVDQSGETDLQKTEKLKADFTEARNYKGLCYFKLKNYQRALSEFDHIITLHPENDVAFYNLGIVKYESKEYEEALKDFLKSR